MWDPTGKKCNKCTEISCHCIIIVVYLIKRPDFKIAMKKFKIALKKFLHTYSFYTIEECLSQS